MEWIKWDLKSPPIEVDSWPDILIIISTTGQPPVKHEMCHRNQGSTFIMYIEKLRSLRHTYSIEVIRTERLLLIFHVIRLIVRISPAYP